MHEETTSMSVPGPVAVSTGQSENSTTPTAVVVSAEVDLDVTPDADNVELQVPFSTNSGGNASCVRLQVNRFAVRNLFSTATSPVELDSLLFLHGVSRPSVRK
jgi:hypothetical protein